MKKKYWELKGRKEGLILLLKADERSLEEKNVQGWVILSELFHFYLI